MLSVSGQLVIHWSCESASRQQIENLKPSKGVSVATQQSDLASTFLSFVKDERENTLFDYDEKFEEDENNISISSKNNLGNVYPLFTPFYNLYSKIFYFKNSQVLLFCKHFFHISYNKFIMFSVFRI